MTGITRFGIPNNQNTKNREFDTLNKRIYLIQKGFDDKFKQLQTEYDNLFSLVGQETQTKFNDLNIELGIIQNKLSTLEDIITNLERKILPR